MKRNIYLMYAIAFLQGMVFYGPVATLYRQAQGVSVFQITLIESISLILCILLEAAWGIAADKIGYRKTMIFCCILYFLSKLVFWRASGFAGFLTERVMLSVVIAGMSGVDTSILYLSCKGENSQKVFGIYHSLQTAGLLTAAAVFSLLVRENYPLSGLLTVLSYGIAAALSLALIEVAPEGERRSGAKGLREALSETFGSRQLLMFLIGSALLNETHQTVTVFLNQLQYEACGLGNAAMGYIYIVATVLGMCGVWSARFTKRAGIPASAAILSAASAVSCLVLAGTKRARPSVCGILMLRVSNSLFLPFQMEMQNRQVRTQYRATALSIQAMLLDSIGAGTNLAFGALAERHLAGAFLFGAGICAGGAALLLKSSRNLGEKQAKS
ncbi:MAG: MFS transporter [Ruminococcus sp.]|nr:MFS transporter [Ruminococcus sp.]